MSGTPERATLRDRLADAIAKDPTVIAAKVDGKVVDLHTPIVLGPGARVEPVRSTDPAGLAVIRHSTAHIMADAVQRLFPGTKVTIGPSIEDGFYYDFDRPDGPFTEEDLAKIESKMLEIIKKNSPFRRQVVERSALLEQFAKMGETYKVEIIERTPQGEELTLYRHGEPGSEWIDFCEGPHVTSTGKLAAIK